MVALMSPGLSPGCTTRNVTDTVVGSDQSHRVDQSSLKKWMVDAQLQSPTRILKSYRGAVRFFLPISNRPRVAIFRYGPRQNNPGEEFYLEHCTRTSGSLFRWLGGKDTQVGTRRFSHTAENRPNIYEAEHPIHRLIKG